MFEGHAWMVWVAVALVLVAIERVNPAGGRVKLAGETWSARTLGDDIEPGEEVVVDSIDGATAIVSRAHVVGS